MRFAAVFSLLAVLLTQVVAMPVVPVPSGTAVATPGGSGAGTLPKDPTPLSGGSKAPTADGGSQNTSPSNGNTQNTTPVEGGSQNTSPVEGGTQNTSPFTPPRLP